MSRVSVVTATVTRVEQAGPTLVSSSFVVEQSSVVSNTVCAAGQLTNGLEPGWIVAIVALVLLSVSLTFNLFHWRKSRNRGNPGYSSSKVYEPQEYEVSRPRPARVREDRRDARFSMFNQR